MRPNLIAAMLLTALVLAGCGIVEEQKDSALRSIAGTVMLPIVKAQSGSPLTQSTWKSSTPVAPRVHEASKPAAPSRTRKEPQPASVRFDLPVTTASIDFATLTPGRARRRALRTMRVAYGFTMESSSSAMSPSPVEPGRCVVIERQEQSGQVLASTPLAGAS